MMMSPVELSKKEPIFVPKQLLRETLGNGLHYKVAGWIIKIAILEKNYHIPEVCKEFREIYYRLFTQRPLDPGLIQAIFERNQLIQYNPAPAGYVIRQWRLISLLGFADYDKRTEIDTCLFIAVQIGSIEMVELLLSCQPSQKGIDHATYATCLLGKKEIVELLKEHKPSEEIKTAIRNNLSICSEKILDSLDQPEENSEISDQI